MSIQEEVQAIHKQYGTTEVANYKIQLLFDSKLKEFRSQISGKVKEIYLKEDRLEAMNALERAIVIINAQT